MVKEKLLPDIKRVEGYRIAVLAKSGHGKSFLARYLIEYILDEYRIPVVIFEPVTEYESLLEIYEGVLFKDEEAVPLEPITMSEVSGVVPVVVINFENTPTIRLRDVAAKFLDLFIERQKKSRKPVLIVFEEAQLFAPQRFTKNVVLLLEKMDYLAKIGRKLGVNYVLISQRPASVNKDVLSQINVLFAGSFSSPRDTKAVVEIAENIGSTLTVNDISKLERGDFIRVCCNAKKLIRHEIVKPSSKHLGGTPFNIGNILRRQVNYEKLLEKAKERLERQKRFVTVSVEEYNSLRALKEENERLRREMEKIRLKLETIQLVAAKLTAEVNDERERIIAGLPRLEQCIYKQLKRLRRAPLYELANKCGSRRSSKRFMQALRRLRELGLIEFSRRGRAWIKD